MQDLGDSYEPKESDFTVFGVDDSLLRTRDDFLSSVQLDEEEISYIKSVAKKIAEILDKGRSKAKAMKPFVILHFLHGKDLVNL